MRPSERQRSNFPSNFPVSDADQRSLDFNPIEATPEEQERLRSIAVEWMLEEAAEEFHQLPGETAAEFWAARQQHLQDLETFGPLFPREPSEAWKMVQGLRQGQGRAPPLKARQLTLLLDSNDTDTENKTENL